MLAHFQGTIRMPEATKEQPAAESPQVQNPKAESPPSDGTQAESPKAKASKEAKPEKPSRPGLATAPLLMGGVVVAALVIGALTGSFVIGPRFVPRRAAETPATPSEEPAAAPEEARHEGGPEARPIVFKVDNIIVNPSGCDGTRFLMASVAFELPNDKIEARLRDHDFMVRDAVIGVLENQTLEALTRSGARDSLRRRLAEAILPMAGRGTRLRVYLPQFVIQ